MSVRIIDSLPELGGQLTALYPEKYVYDMPGFPKVLAKDLARDLISQGLQFQPEVVLDQTAMALGSGQNGYVIRTPSGEFPTKTIVLAAGAGAFSPTKLGIEREAEFHGKGLHYGVRDKSIFAGKKVVIVGGGDSAFDWAMDLERIASEILLVHRRDVFRAHEDSVAKVKASTVQLKLFATVGALHGSDRLEAVTLHHGHTNDEERIEVDHVIVNVGFKSSLGPLKEWGLEIEKNQIVVDGKFETNLPGVFAVGDVATYPGKLKLIATGVGEAVSAVCQAKIRLDPESKLFPGHSSDMEMPGTTK